MKPLHLFLLLASPILVLAYFAITMWVGMPPFDGLTRATIALVVIAYELGLLAGMWLMVKHYAQPTPPQGMNH